MRHPLMSGSILLLSLSPCLAQLVPHPIDRFESLTWGMPIQAVRSILGDPPLTVSRRGKTGEVLEKNGHMFLERIEQIVGMKVRASYAFSVKDSALRYILITAFEMSRLSGSVKGERDSLWQRVARRYGPAAETLEGSSAKREWRAGGTSIVCYRTDGLARALVLTLAPVGKR